MASVALDFTPPLEDNIVALRIYESPDKDGSYVQIDRITAVGIAPLYISHYSTQLAGSSTDWFAIAWEDDAGVVSELSTPVQGGTQTLVNRLVQRVMLRDSGLDENVVTEVAEWVIGKVKQTTDPYDATLTVTLNEIEGMTLLTLARSELNVLMLSSTDESYTAGLVSQRSSAGTNRASMRDTIKFLIAEANKLLGLNVSFVMLLEDIDPIGICETAVGWDITRSLWDTQIV